MEITYYVVDAFTRKRFAGNSAAVVEFTHWPGDAILQNIAAENNLSETAFLVPEGENHYHIRWFSPLCEIDFCGHATLASAYVLFNQKNKQGVLTFETKAVGTLSIELHDDGRIAMHFPNLAPTPVDPPAALVSGLDQTPLKVLKNRQAYVVVLADEHSVRQCQYRSDDLKQLAPYDVVITAPGQEYDFVSRYFWPANGSDEDPVTGSIHAALAPYWAEQLGRNKLRAWQASSRGGELFCEVTAQQVVISGFGVLYAKGVCFIDD